MAEALAYLKQRVSDDWLISYDNRQLTQLAQQLYLELTHAVQHGKPLKIILAERNPVQFLARFVAAVAAGCPVFLCNPDWVEAEWRQVFDLVQPDLIWGADLTLPNPSVARGEGKVPTPGFANSSLIMIPTGGSSGQIRFAIHTWDTLMASVRGFRQYFQINQVNSFCVLPLYHVSGLMQFMRSYVSGGKLVIMPFKGLESCNKSDIKESEFFISLVPTQLQRLLQNPALSTWLSRFQTVLLGGAPAWPELLEQARSHSIRLALTYGMTETASQIATLKPEAFLKGANSCGQVLPHAKVTICTPNGSILGANQTGTVTIHADSLALGYYPDIFANSQRLQVDDLGFFDRQGYLNIIGRNSNKIISGGENVFPNEIEAAIRSTNLVNDVCIIGLPDSHWGQVVVAVYVPREPQVTVLELKAALEDKLSKYKWPKYWVEVEAVPRNTQGKVNNKKVQHIIHTWLDAQQGCSQLG